MSFQRTGEDEESLTSSELAELDAQKESLKMPRVRNVNIVKRLSHPRRKVHITKATVESIKFVTQITQKLTGSQLSKKAIV